MPDTFPADHSQETEEDIFVVEMIKDKRVKDGKVHYKIKWLGYSENECTWEEEENILDKDMINDFEENQRTKKNKKKKPTTDTNSKKPTTEKLTINKEIKRMGTIEMSEIAPEEALPSDKVTTLNHLTKFAENIDMIECVFRDGSETLLAYVILKNRGRTVFPVSQLKELAPYKLIEYYESKLRFADSTK